jgi:hypothetical protein
MSYKDDNRKSGSYAPSCLCLHYTSSRYLEHISSNGLYGTYNYRDFGSLRLAGEAPTSPLPGIASRSTIASSLLLYGI